MYVCINRSFDSLYLISSLVLILILFFSAKIQSMKYSIPKGDKKKKKEVTLEIAKLEEELNEKHKKELESSENVSTVSCMFPSASRII